MSTSNIDKSEIKRIMDLLISPDLEIRLLAINLLRDGPLNNIEIRYWDFLHPPAVRITKTVKDLCKEISQNHNLLLLNSMDLFPDIIFKHSPLNILYKLLTDLSK